jgi:hypothetical protein
MLAERAGNGDKLCDLGLLCYPLRPMVDKVEVGCRTKQASEPAHVKGSPMFHRYRRERYHKPGVLQIAITNSSKPCFF